MGILLCPLRRPAAWRKTYYTILLVLPCVVKTLRAIYRKKAQRRRTAGRDAGNRDAAAPPYRRPDRPAKGTVRLSAPFRHGAPFAEKNRRSAFFVTLHKNDAGFSTPKPAKSYFWVIYRRFFSMLYWFYKLFGKGLTDVANRAAILSGSTTLSFSATLHN